ncbi:penicillin-binding protein 1C [Parasegetibacter sp. NRK P23]|uniref:penicillin-binding protein 1C n=1 Tax=Parasegetibacter sp. NRK P23 TaxID=2942999 RepID=UPI00204368C3|nr:penicillin-binding protein 1C [Parasegetibacter sp. NRK P23]MCM5529069.1 penicillin-binding protein 1C [Parasegetibacter sp. NRK P23]
MKKHKIKVYFGRFRRTRTGKFFLFLVLPLVVLFFLLNALFPLPALKDHSVIIRDHKGQLAHAFLTHDEKWRMYAEADEISPLLRKTLIEKEDHYFYYHFGVNPIAAGRAFFQNLFSGRRVSGASTITMQVAKMLDRSPRTWGNKFKEVFRALQLEWKYSKQEIFQLYCNLLPYGGNIEGIKAASLLYLGKDPDHLSLAEIVTLSIIPNRPSAWRIGVHNEALFSARNHWLKKLSSSGIFTEKEINDALSEPLEAWRRPVPRQIPHLARRLSASGSDVHTAIEMNRQLQVEQLLQAYVNGITHRGIRNAAALVVDNQTGKVIAYVGSSDFWKNPDGGQVDGITAIRQPGSTLKPFLYALCIDEGLYTPKSVMHDVPVFYDGYAPENYDRRFNGEVTLEYALEHSLNIPAVKAMAALGKDRFIDELTRAGFAAVARKRKALGLSVALGGCGATLEELTALFAAIAREGVYRPLRYREKDEAGKGKKLVSPAAAFMITETLSKVNRPDFPLHWSSTEHMPRIAWKTGTSYGRRDAWSIGFNKKYTVGVWVGNFSGVSAPDLSGADIATPLLFRIFNAIDYNGQTDWYAPTPDCELRTVCAETGLPPSAHCTQLVSDYFIPLISPATTCDNRREYHVSADEKISYCVYCTPAAGYKKKMYRVMPPSLQAYYNERRIAYDHIPPHNPSCEKLFKGSGPVIISPQGGTVYYTSPDDPDMIRLSCQTSNDVLKVYWYINNKFYRAAAAGEKLFFKAVPGETEVVCTDDKGRSSKVRISVEHY